MSMFEVVASGWYTDETDELEFDDDSDLELAAEDRANREYIDTDDEPYYPAEIGI